MNRCKCCCLCCLLAGEPHFSSVFQVSMYLERGEHSLIWAILVCAAPKGMVFRRFGPNKGIDFGHFGLK